MQSAALLLCSLEEQGALRKSSLVGLVLCDVHNILVIGYITVLS